MKQLPFYLLVLLLICGCTNTNNTIQGFEWADYSKEDAICAYIKYNQQVNGYDVSAICLVDTLYNEVYSTYNSTAIKGHGFIHFQNDKYEFIVENPLFSDNNLSKYKQSLKNGMLIETDYIPFEPANDTLNNMLFNVSQSPFFFFDINFDGEKELIVTLFEGMGYHGHNAYKAYKIPITNECIILSPIQREPFDKLNDYTGIDTIKKEIEQPYGFGIRFGGMKKYGLVTHTVFNEAMHSIEERQFIELTEIEHYDWQHTEKTGCNACEPTIYHYKKINGDIKLTNIEKCPNDK